MEFSLEHLVPSEHVIFPNIQAALGVTLVGEVASKDLVSNANDDCAS